MVFVNFYLNSWLNSCSIDGTLSSALEIDSVFFIHLNETLEVHIKYAQYINSNDIL